MAAGGGERRDRRWLLTRLGSASVGVLSTRWTAVRPSAAASLPSPRFCDITTDQSSPPAAAFGPDLPSEVGGEWSPPVPGPHGVVGVHAVLLHTGQVLVVEGTRAATWRPDDGAATRVDPPVDLFCCGHAQLPDGRIFFAGGAKTGPPPTWTAIYDPVTGSWSRGPDMRQGRWYPTVTTLADGRALITTGDVDRSSSVNDDVEVFDPVDGTMVLVGTRPFGLYPHQFVLPDGRVAIAGPTPRDVAVLDPSDWSWSEFAELERNHHDGSGILLPSGPAGSSSLMLVGSSFAGGASTEVIDLAAPLPAWARRATLPEPRAHMNLVLLPDGGLLGVGGTNAWGSVHHSLLYDPLADTWATMASQVEVRGYHSTALLLPDGRVLSAGDNIEPGGLDTLELYSPPYLFRGQRPTVERVPEAVAWGERFVVATTGAVVRAVLVRPGAVTHTNDMDQRHVELRFRALRRGGEARLIAPSSPAVAPPGHYMLFVIDDRGVPSTAGWLRLGR
jgi:hypothetical protein